MKLKALIICVILIGAAIPIYGQAGNIDSTFEWAWGENIGWADFSSTAGSVTVETYYLMGYIRVEKAGWINLGDGTPGGGDHYGNASYADFGVNNDGAGNLYGYGWNENVGWINFSSGNYPERVTIDENGNFSGYAWARKAGWVNFSSLGSVSYRVKTDWNYRTISGTVTESGSGLSGVTITASGGSGSDTTDGDGNYTLSVSDGWSGTVTPSKTGYGFVPSQRSYSNLASSQVDQDYTAVLKKHTLTVNVSGTGEVSKDPDRSSYVEGTEVELTAAAGEHWSFSEWTGDLSGGGSPETITMSADREVTAVFTQTLYTVTTRTSGNGSVSLDPSGGSYVYGTEVELSANASTGSTFSSWTGDLTGGLNPSTVTVDGSMDITAVFETNQYTLTADTSGDGSVGLVPPGGSYDYGTEVALTASANAGSGFSRWTGDLLGSNTPRTLTMDGNKAVTAIFSSDLYGISGTVIEDGSGLSGVTVSATGKSNETTDGAGFYSFTVADAWSGTVTPSKTGYGFFPADRSYNEISAHFSDQTFEASLDGYTLTVNLDGSGTVSKAPDWSNYTYGTWVSLTATADSGWNFVNWSGDLSGSFNHQSIEMDGNKTVEAHFTEVSYTLNVGISPAGTGSVAKDPDLASYGEGTEVALTATGSTGYSFDHWGGDLSGTDNPKTITMDGNKSVTAYFAEDQYELLVEVEGSGSVVKEPSFANYTYGSWVELSANADSGWGFSRWEEDLTGWENPTDIQIAGPTWVKAYFLETPKVLTLRVSGSGSAGRSPDWAVYTASTEVTITATADTGYSFSQWTGDLEDAFNSQTTVVMETDKDITAVFTENLYGISGNVTRDGNGLSGVTVSATGEADETTDGVGFYSFTVSEGWGGTVTPLKTGYGFTPEWRSFTTVSADYPGQHFAASELEEYTLTLHESGSGTTSKYPDQTTYYYGAEVQVIASASGGHDFSEWTGSLTGSANPTTVTIDGNKDITAVFLEYFDLTIHAANGTVTRSPDETEYLDGAVVSLTAAAGDPDYRFACFTGDLESSINPDTITVDGDKDITAVFEQAYELTVSVSPGAGGSVSKAPDQVNYFAQSEVQLTATANAGYVFSQWSGAASGSSNPTTVTMTEDTAATAIFEVNISSSDRWGWMENAGWIDFKPTDGGMSVTGEGLSGYAYSNKIGWVKLGVDNGPSYGNTGSGDWGVNNDGFGNLSGYGWCENVGWVNFSTDDSRVTIDHDGNFSGYAWARKSGWVNFSSLGPVDYGVKTEWGYVEITGTVTGGGGGLSGVALSTTGEGGSDTTGAGGNYELNVPENWSGTLTPSKSGYTFTPSSRDYSSLSEDTDSQDFTGSLQEWTLSVSTDGSGWVEKDPDLATYTNGTEVELTPHPDGNWFFDGWSGDLSGDDDPATLVMNGDKTVTATFKTTYTLQARTNDAELGSVTRSPDFAEYTSGTLVSLSAEFAQETAAFSHWTGDLSGSVNPTSLTMSADKDVTAVFLEYFTLAVNAVNGTVSRSPDEEKYLDGASVSLTATGDNGYLFKEWQDDLSGSNNPESITINGNKSVTAVFDNAYTLTVNTSGSGTVSKSPDRSSYLSGAQVNLTATASSGWEFDHWEEDLSGSANPASITMSGNKNVTAVFTSNISDSERWAWAENAGWIDFKPSGGGMAVTGDGLSGHAYSDKIGWVKLGSTGAPPYANSSHADWGVNNDGGGNLSGYGWCENVGWINFSSNDSRISIDQAGNFSGYAWAKKAGWVNFSSLGPVDYRVNTDWRYWEISGTVSRLSGGIPGVTLSAAGLKDVATDVNGDYTINAPDGWSGTVTPAKTGYTFEPGSREYGSLNENTDSQDYTTFKLYTLTINTAGSGSGSVSKSPDPYQGSSYIEETEVTLTASAATGSSFDYWGGDLSGSVNPEETITMDGNKSVTAFFAQDEYTLTLTEHPGAGGTILPVPSKSSYNYNDEVTLYISPYQGYGFAHWGGALSGNEYPETLTMTGNTTVDAYFVENPYTLTLYTTGQGTASKDPDWANYSAGMTVEVTAGPANHWKFHNWTGDLSGATNPDDIVMDSHKTVWANFTNYYDLNVTVVHPEGGHVDKTPDQTGYEWGTSVTLTAVVTDGVGWGFAGWTGALSGILNPKTFSIADDMEVTATFSNVLYTISGTVTNAWGNFSDVTVSATGQTPVETDANGLYSVEVVEGWNGDVTPEEYYYSFNPSSRSYSSGVSEDKPNQNFTAIADDTDHDGMPDWWEIKYEESLGGNAGMNYLVNDAAGDNDADGWLNLAEWNAYTMAQSYMDPRDAASGGQLVELEEGWNLISITVNKCWYDSNITGGEPTSMATNYVNVYQDSQKKWHDLVFKDSLGDNYTIVLSQNDGDDSFDRTQPATSTLELISPDEGFWINMLSAGILQLNGERIKASGGYYPAITLHSGSEQSGWTLLPFLPKTCYYVSGNRPNLEATNDLTGEKGTYSTVSQMLQSAFDMDSNTWGAVESIQVLYPPEHGGLRCYGKGLPWQVQSLKFILPGYGSWINMTDTYGGGYIEFDGNQ